jgi:ABC-2 type transport system ATP-binding protein
MIKVEKLVFDYPGHRALHDISFTIAAGTVTALVGANGAGKTTLMRCIAGLEEPLSGRITVAGMDVVEQPRAVHAQMGYLSDFFGLYQELTVARCLEYAAASQGMPRATIPDAVIYNAQRLGLSDRLAQKAGELSRGLRQRLAIAQAIIHSPKVLLLDEPASGLDPQARGSLAVLFRQLQSEGMTLLVSSHILAELDEYSTHMLALRDGKVLEHRSLDAPSAQALLTHRMRVELAVPSALLGSVLEAHPGVVMHHVDEISAQFELNADSSEQATLLASLIGAGLRVSSFAEQKENLQQSYLRSMQGSEGVSN